MKRLSTAFLVICLLVSAINGKVLAQTTTNQSYVNNEYGISALYPKDWTLIENSNNYLLEARAPKLDATINLYAVAQGENDIVSIVEKYIEYNKMAYENIELTAINHYESSSVLKFKVNVMNTNVIGEQYFAQVGDYLYMVAFTSEEATYPVNNNILKEFFYDLSIQGKKGLFLTGNTISPNYTNEKLGLSCVLPPDWSITEEEEGMEVNAIAPDRMATISIKAMELPFQMPLDVIINAMLEGYKTGDEYYQYEVIAKESNENQGFIIVKMTNDTHTAINKQYFIMTENRLYIIIFNALDSRYDQEVIHLERLIENLSLQNTKIYKEPNVPDSITDSIEKSSTFTDQKSGITIKTPPSHWEFLESSGSLAMWFSPRESAYDNYREHISVIYRESGTPYDKNKLYRDKSIGRTNVKIVEDVKISSDPEDYSITFAYETGDIKLKERIYTRVDDTGLYQIYLVAEDHEFYEYNTIMEEMIKSLVIH